MKPGVNIGGDRVRYRLGAAMRIVAVASALSLAISSAICQMDAAKLIAVGQIVDVTVAADSTQEIRHQRRSRGCAAWVQRCLSDRIE
jgi:hypothetical protein